jgi:hypothetical protein
MMLLINYAATSQQSSQAFLESYGSTGTQEMFYKTSVLRGTDGYNYVCGATLNSDGNYDMLLTKMTVHNVVVWTQQYAGAAGGDDFAADLVQDGAGNIIITGAEYISATNYNAVTIKYNSSGVQQWLKSYNGVANSYDGGISVVRDASNNIYMCGGSYGATTFSDFLCVKYNSSGVQQWASTWNSMGMQDVSARLAVSATQVSVIGASQQSANDWKMATTFFNVNTGAFLGVKLTGGDDEGIDKVADLAIDASDNTYVVGAVRNINKAYDIKVIKLSSTYTVLWQQTFNGTANLNDEGLSLELTSTNDVVVCGFTTTTDEDKNFITRKYSGSSGALLWSKTFDEQEGEDKATDLKLDASGNAIICGSSYKDGNLDYVVQKLKNTTGDVIWTGRWNGDANLNDLPMNLAIDENDNTVYVAGQSEVMANKYKYYVTRWSQKDVYMPKPVDGFSSSGGYIQNREQLRNADGTTNSSVKYYCQQNSPATFIDDSKISYIFASVQVDTIGPDTVHRVDMVFKKGIANAKIYPTNERTGYTNYYLGHMSQKAERTSSYNSIIKLGAYTNTDIVFTNNSSGYRHWIVARSGAPTASFEMEYSGQNSLSINANGDLVFGTIFGDIVQPKAKVYTMNNTTGVLTLLGWQPDYVVSGNLVSFNYTGGWSGTLVIEFGNQPGSAGQSVQELNVDWSTMFGGLLREGFEQTIAADADDVYAAGWSESLSFANVGETISQTTGLEDVILVNFNAACEAVFLTYYGGEGNERTNDIERSAQTGDIFIVGRTASTDIDIQGIEMEDNTLNGGGDGFYAKFSASGQLLFHTYVGGNGLDYCQGIAHAYHPGSNTDLIYYCGYTSSGSGWPALVAQANSDQMEYSGGFDGFIIKRSGADQEVVWSTFFGSTGDDFLQHIDLVRGSPILIGGTNHSTYSSQQCGLPTDGNFPKCHGASWGAEFFDNGGTAEENHFVAYFGDDGTNPNQFFDQLKWCSYLCPKDPTFTSQPFEPQIAASNSGWTFEDIAEIYFTGWMPLPTDQSDLTFPFANEGWNQDNVGGGSSDSFICKFRMSGNTILQTRGTLYGGAGEDYITSVALAPNGNLFVGGWSIIATIQDENDWCTPPADNTFPMCNLNGLNYMETNISTTNGRAFVGAFLPNGQMRWSTQYGEGYGSYITGVTANADKAWVVGRSAAHWTPEEYDENSLADYYRDFDPGNGVFPEAAIARFDIQTIVGINESSQEPPIIFNLFPNPTNQDITLQLGKDLVNQQVEIRVYDMLGQLVLNTKSANTEFIPLTIEALAAGTYTLTLICAESNLLLHQAFVKQ